MSGLRIRQVAQETGLSEQVIRKWEQRYGAVTPERLDNGYRVYSTNEVRRLLHIKQLVDEGMAVSQAVEAVQHQVTMRGPNLANPNAWGDRHGATQQVRTLSTTTKDDNTVSGTSELLPATHPLVKAGEQGHLQTIENTLQQMYATHGLHFLVQSVILPFLRTVGDKWEKGEWSEYQEHLATLTVRDFLVRCTSSVPPAVDNSRSMLMSCVPGERHDMMLNVIGLEAGYLGWSTTSLGPSPAPSAVEHATARLRPRVALLSISTTTPLSEVRGIDTWFSAINDFAKDVRHQTKFFLGGPEHIVGTLTKELPYIQPVSDLSVFMHMLMNHP